MKKKIISLLLVLSAFFITGVVSAKEISKDDIKPGTYMIGTHLFTRESSGDYNGTLTVRYIMLAARTINSDDINDMVIYLKNSRGKWVNAVTNEEVTVPDKVDICYENSVEESLPRIDIFSYLDIEHVQWWFEPLTDLFDRDSTKKYEFELYEKTSSGYELVDTQVSPNGKSIPWAIIIDATNEVKTYVGRLTTINANGKKINSDYSEELTVDTKNKLAAPKMTSELNIQYDSSRADWIFRMYLDEEFKNRYGYSSDIRYDFELSEKTDSGYVYVDDAFTEGTRGKYAVADISNEEKTYVARLYITNSKGEKIYSNYSEELKLNVKDSIPTPEIFYECDENTCSIRVSDEDFKNSCNGSNSCLSSADKLVGNYYYNVYEKNGSKIDDGRSYEEGRKGKIASVNISSEEKTYVAKLYLINSKGEEVVSKESNEITIAENSIVKNEFAGMNAAAESVSFIFKNDVYKKYSNIEILYRAAGNTNWQLYSDEEISADGMFDIKRYLYTVAAEIKVRLYKVENGQRIYSNECGLYNILQLDEVTVVGSLEEQKQKITYKFKNDIYTIYTNIEVSYMYEGETTWELYSDTIAATEEFEIEQTFGQIPVQIRIRLYNVVGGNNVYSDEYIVFYDPNTPLLIGSGIAVDPDTNKKIVSYMFKNDIYTKYTNIEVSYMYEGETDWELYSDTIEANKVFDIEHNGSTAPSKIKVRLYKVENGQRIYSEETIIQ